LARENPSFSALPITAHRFAWHPIQVPPAMKPSQHVWRLQKCARERKASLHGGLGGVNVIMRRGIPQFVAKALLNQ
jgi:hypothetical protein